MISTDSTNKWLSHCREMISYSTKNLDGGRGKPRFEITKLVRFNYLFSTKPQSQKNCNLEIESQTHQDIRNSEILWNIGTVCC